MLFFSDRVRNFCFLILFFIPLMLTAQSVYINEIMASNSHTLIDPDFKQFSDWIEIVNTGSQTVDLTGFSLSDDNSNVWYFPENTTLMPDSFLIVFADGQNIADEALHGGFKLGRRGDAVRLMDAQSTVADECVYTLLETDISMGRSASAASQWVYFDQATPGTANSNTGVVLHQRAAPPAASLNSGQYQGAQWVELTAAAGTAIYYTLDGSLPTTESHPYSSPILLNETTVLRARGFSTDRLVSLSADWIYIIDESHELPIVSLITPPDFLWDNDLGVYVDNNISRRKNWERKASLTFLKNNQVAFKSRADFRLFGRSAIYIPQKSLALFPDNPMDFPLFQEDSILPHHSFLLRSSSDDWHRTLLADAFIQQLLKPHFNLDIQEYQPAVLYLNNRYWGIHNIREKYNEDYLLTHHAETAAGVDLIYLDVRDNTTDLLSGDMNDYDDLMAYIESHDLTVPAHYDAVAARVNIENFIDFCIVQQYSCNISWKHNIRLWRPRIPGGRWHFLVFDMDRGFQDSSWDNVTEMQDKLSLFGKLIENQTFKNQYIMRMQQHINISFTPERVIGILDSLTQRIASAMPMHIEKWSGQCSHVCGISSMDAWQNAVNELKNFARTRPALMQQQLNALNSSTPTHALSVAVSPACGGSIYINQTLAVQDTFNGFFPQGTSFNLQAAANDGYIFDEWQQVLSQDSLLIAAESVWHYWDSGINPGSNWAGIDFDDSGWASGQGELGFGDGGENTLVSYGDDAGNKFITTWFRHQFTLEEIDKFESLTLSLMRDDGAVVYLNGEEILRSNMPDGEISPQTLASSAVGQGDEASWFSFILPVSSLISGVNTLAVEIHQVNTSSSDLSFDLSLSARLAFIQQTEELVPLNRAWQYNDQGQAADNWQSIAFDDSNWRSGNAPLGFGDADIATVIGYGDDPEFKHNITWFRHAFVLDSDSYDELTLQLVRDDGAVVYLNGHEIARSNLPQGQLTENTFASAYVSDADETIVHSFPVDADLLLPGKNVLAAAVYQANRSSSDLRFNCGLQGMQKQQTTLTLSKDKTIQYDVTANAALTAVFSVDSNHLLPSAIDTELHLTQTHSPYIARQDVDVTPSGRLIIDPGVTLKMAAGVHLVIHGSIQASGTAAEPIQIQSLNTSPWGMLAIDNARETAKLSHLHLSGCTRGPEVIEEAGVNIIESTAELSHIQIENAQQSLYGYRSRITLSHSRLDGTQTGGDLIHMFHGQALLENNTIVGLGEIDFDFVDGVTLRHNHFINTSHDSNADGIDIGTCLNAVIEYNRLENCPDKGISVGEASTALLRHNVILNCGIGIAVKDSSMATIDKNTLYQNGIGVSCYEKNAGSGGGQAVIRNTLFSGSIQSDIAIDDLSSATVNYSLSDTESLNGIGNLQADPLFADANGHDFSLRTDSPCIDAGDPESSVDVDGSTADIGAVAFNSQFLRQLQNLRINEVMAGNQTTVTDENGQFSDWIELYNKNDVPLDVGGLWLTDTADHYQFHQIPADRPDSTTIPAHGYLIFWASGQADAGWRHLNFKLSRNGEFIGLSRFSGHELLILDSLHFGLQTTDISYGRLPDGSAAWQCFNTPTPGTPNKDNNTHVTAQGLPVQFALHQNFPNPFNPRTMIQFDLPQKDHLLLTIMDVRGRLVRQLLNQSCEAGYHALYWDGTNDRGQAVAAGLYFYALKTESGFAASHKMILIK